MTGPPVRVNPYVLKMPGISREFVDSLLAEVPRIRTIDTLPTSVRGGHPTLGGRYAANGGVQINPNLGDYKKLYRELGRSRFHPSSTANPRGVLAHEIGHGLNRGLLEARADSFALAHTGRLPQSTLRRRGEVEVPSGARRPEEVSP